MVLGVAPIFDYPLRQIFKSWRAISKLISYWNLYNNWAREYLQNKFKKNTVKYRQLIHIISKPIRDRLIGLREPYPKSVLWLKSYSIFFGKIVSKPKTPRDGPKVLYEKNSFKTFFILSLLKQVETNLLATCFYTFCYTNNSKRQKIPSVRCFLGILISGY